MKKVFESQITDEVLVCPYCMEPKGYDVRSCCGESSTHFENAYEVDGEEIFLGHEIDIIPDDTVPTLPSGNQPNLSNEKDEVVPLDEVKSALQVANCKKEDYSSAVLSFLVRKYTVFAFLGAFIALFGCAPYDVIYQAYRTFPLELDGKDGKSCTVTKVVNGALIQCQDGSSVAVINGQHGTNGQDGQDGQDAPQSQFNIVGTIDPCGTQSTFDEVLLILANGQILAHYAAGARQFLTFVPPGNYTTSDGTNCHFTITTNNEVINEHN